ncbi:hypothetical protein PN497_02405 [Sphaerospermopsis kisseleviana CS-549]|uniref:Uncharacterized protein n=1 Tax=Sphaerospermopsis kisseleviana CS-549 TaxID=3021783 RepID=A0ABT4ZLG8_9CYAN|nr:hypothetical protein [Sphaerospermopsis kisseleviana]MDB9440236.1 hypothetical protein [Sphaerospermopsis kisseleviana CS-549]
MIGKNIINYLLPTTYYPVPSPQSPVTSPQSPVSSLQSPVSSTQSPVPIPQSPICKILVLTTYSVPLLGVWSNGLLILGGAYPYF